MRILPVSYLTRVVSSFYTFLITQIRGTIQKQKVFQTSLIIFANCSLVET